MKILFVMIVWLVTRFPVMATFPTVLLRFDFMIISFVKMSRLVTRLPVMATFPKVLLRFDEKFTAPKRLDVPAILILDKPVIFDETIRLAVILVSDNMFVTPWNEAGPTT
jgi:hypothetical protein